MNTSPESVPENPQRVRLQKLAHSFPSLRDAPGISAWDPEALDDWAIGPVPGSGAFRSAQFILSVWNSQADWKCGTFCAVRALQTWDSDHRAAFQAWVVEPWWP